MFWDEKILETIDKDELESLCNPLYHYQHEEEELLFLVILFSE